MASENLRIDENTRWTLGAVTNDSDQFIKNLRVNPVTGRLIVEANITSTNTSIGSTIPGGTEGSVLFLGPGSTLDEDNSYFFYDATNHFLGLGTTTPAANLHVDGSVQFDLGADATGDIYYRDVSGNLINLSIGADTQVLTVSGGVPTWQNAGSGTAGYDTIQNEGVSVTQRSTINLTNLLTATDVSSKTELTVNVANLANDSTFLSNLNLSDISGTIDLSTQVSGTLTVSNGGTGASTLTGVLVGNGTSAVTATSIAQGDLFYGSAAGVLSKLAKNTSATRYLSNTGTSNNPAWAQIDLSNGVTGQLSSTNIDESSLNLSTIGGTLNLASQVTGVLNLSNGGTGANLSDPGANKVMGWDDTDNSVGFWTLGSGLSYDHASHTLSSDTNVSVVNVNGFDDFISANRNMTNDTTGEYYISSGNFAVSGALGQYVGGVTNHPGILQSTGSGQVILGFAEFDNGSPATATNGSIMSANDFTLEFLKQHTYSGSGTGIASEENFYIKASGTNMVQISTRISTAIFTVVLRVNNSIVSTLATPTKPTSGQWYTLKIEYVSGVLKITMNGTIIYNTATVFTGDNGRVEISQGSSLGTTQYDYCKYNYQVTR